MQQHGFARNLDWDISATSADLQPDERDPSVELVLTDNDYTRAMWWGSALLTLLLGSSETTPKHHLCSFISSSIMNACHCKLLHHKHYRKVAGVRFWRSLLLLDFISKVT